MSGILAHEIFSLQIKSVLGREFWCTVNVTNMNIIARSLRESWHTTFSRPTDCKSVLWRDLYHNHELNFYTNNFAASRGKFQVALYQDTPFMALFQPEVDEDGNMFDLFNDPLPWWKKN